MIKPSRRGRSGEYIGFRASSELKGHLESAAQESGRSLSTEVQFRLERSFWNMDTFNRRGAMDMIKLGQKVRDSITGFEGIATARTEWLHGCMRVAIESQEMKDGKPIDAIWFDELRVEVLADTNHQGERATTGGPRPEGVRVADPWR